MRKREEQINHGGTETPRRIRMLGRFREVNQFESDE